MPKVYDISGRYHSSGNIPGQRSKYWCKKFCEVLIAHLMHVRPDERRFITAEMIRKTSFIGTAADLIRRVGGLRDAGFDQVVFSIPPGQDYAIEDWGRIRRAFG